MSRKKNRVPYRLDTKNIKNLRFEEIQAILRGADELIMHGGRQMLAKVLKGSKEKKLLELGLDKNPYYGYYKGYSLEDVMARIDWMILNNYLAVEYDNRLPLLVYTDWGWEIEKDQYSDELVQVLLQCSIKGDFEFVKTLRQRPRKMIMLLLDKIAETKDPRFIPVLNAWQEHDYKKVRQKINAVIQTLQEA